MISILSLSKAVRGACKPRAASVSTNAAIDRRLQTRLVQDFRDQFWKAAFARSAKRDGDDSANGKSVLAMPSSRARARAIENANSFPMQEDDKAVGLRRRAREDLFKHFRMSAASRAVKRGDGAPSDFFSLDDNVQPNHQIGGSDASSTELPSLIDIATATKAREDMRQHFWSSYHARKDGRETEKASLTTSTKTPAFPSAHRGLHQHEHRFKLPTTLNAFLEGSRRRGENDRPRPMAITEIEPPFKIVDVNRDWTRLCGYTREEAVGSTLKEFLQGPETNAIVARGLISSLLQQDNWNTEHEAVLVNYRSDGRKFKNHVRVGRIENEAGETTHFIGLFEKLSDDDLSSASHDDLYANA